MKAARKKRKGRRGYRTIRTGAVLLSQVAGLSLYQSREAISSP